MRSWISTDPSLTNGPESRQARLKWHFRAIADILLLRSATFWARTAQCDSCISAANWDKSKSSSGKKGRKPESTEREPGFGSAAFGLEYYILKAVIFSSIDSLLLCCPLLTRPNSSLKAFSFIAQVNESGPVLKLTGEKKKMFVEMKTLGEGDSRLLPSNRKERSVNGCSPNIL